MRLLVAGGDRVDAGKTTFAAGLTARRGVPAFKPRAGNSYWFDHGDCRAALGEGRLYGNDARRLVAAAPVDTTPESINAVHRLWRPAPGGGDGLIGPSGTQFVCDRVGAGEDRRYVVNAGADVPAAVREALPLESATVVDSVDALDAVMERVHRPALRAVAERGRASEDCVVESYGDVAWPLEDLVVDAVAVVEPGRVRVYDGDRYRRAREVAGRTLRDGRLEEPVDDVVSHLDPAATVGLPPLPDATRREPAAVADAYADAYDALVAAGA